MINEYDARFNYTFQNVYSQPGWNNTWYLVAGNHDHYGNVSGQVAYTQRDPTGRWYFPALNYDVVFNISDSVSAHFIFLDTCAFSSAPTPTPSPLSYVCSRYDLTSESHRLPPNVTRASETLAWLNSTLAQSRSKWRLLFTHYPYLSAAGAMRPPRGRYSRTHLLMVCARARLPG